MSLLEAKFTKQFSGFKLDIEFTMNHELLVLFGPSGAGKSVTLKLLAGLLTPDAGHLRMSERELYNHASHINIKPQTRNIGYVFQNHSIFPHMTVKQNIVFGAKGIAPHEAKIQAEELLYTFDLIGLENKYPREISGGQQQRVALAMSLIRRPQALLLDEPFSALDNLLRIKMREWLKNILPKFKIPIILVTHDSIEACALADQILVYNNGTIAEQILPSSERFVSFQNLGK